MLVSPNNNEEINKSSFYMHPTTKTYIKLFEQSYNKNNIVVSNRDNKNTAVSNSVNRNKPATLVSNRNNNILCKSNQNSSCYYKLD